MKKKMFFEEPELEVVHFDPKDIYTRTSSDCEEYTEDKTDDCSVEGEGDF